MSNKRYFAFRLVTASIIYIISFVSNNISQAQPSEKISKSDSLNKEWIIKNYFQDQAKLWTSPLRYNKGKIYLAVSIATATAFAMTFDKTIQSDIQEVVDRNKWMKSSASVISYGGNGLFVSGVISILYFGGLAIKDDKAKQTGMMAAYALLNTALIEGVAKFVTGRARPYTNNNPDEWHWLSDYTKNSKTIGDGRHSSFPSGHSSVTWALATVIATEYNDNHYVPPIIYTLATAVSLSRVIENDHWLSDVIAGSAIGFGVGKFVVHHHKHTKWTLLPTCSQKNVYLTCITKL